MPTRGGLIFVAGAAVVLALFTTADFIWWAVAAHAVEPWPGWTPIFAFVVVGAWLASLWWMRQTHLTLAGICFLSCLVSPAGYWVEISGPVAMSLALFSWHAAFRQHHAVRSAARDLLPR